MRLRTWTRYRRLGLFGSSTPAAGVDAPGAFSRRQSKPGTAEQALDARKAGNRRFAGQESIHAGQTENPSRSLRGRRDSAENGDARASTGDVPGTRTAPLIEGIPIALGRGLRVVRGVAGAWRR